VSMQRVFVCMAGWATAMVFLASLAWPQEMNSLQRGEAGDMLQTRRFPSSTYLHVVPAPVERASGVESVEATAGAGAEENRR
jgi:hypothetical protein